MGISGFWEFQIFDNPIKKWAIALGIAIFVYILSNVAKRVMLNTFRSLPVKTNKYTGGLIACLIERTNQLFLMTGSIYVASAFLTINSEVQIWIRGIAIGVFFIQFGFWVTRFLEYFISRHENENVRNLFKIIATGITWVMILLWALENLGIEVGAFITSLGITGIVLGLALQEVLGDVFAAISITVDKPFKVGDLIDVGEHAGRVEKLGWKSTRIRSLGGELLLIGNSDLLSSRIKNYEEQKRRRVAFVLGVSYETSYENLRKIPAMIEEFISTLDNVKLDRVHLKELNESSIDFEVVYFIDSPDYVFYMDTQQAINYALLKTFEELDIELAHPNLTLHHVMNSWADEY